MIKIILSRDEFTSGLGSCVYGKIIKDERTLDFESTSDIFFYEAEARGFSSSSLGKYAVSGIVSDLWPKGPWLGLRRDDFEILVEEAIVLIGKYIMEIIVIESKVLPDTYLAVLNNGSIEIMANIDLSLAAKARGFVHSDAEMPGYEDDRDDLAFDDEDMDIRKGIVFDRKSDAFSDDDYAINLDMMKEWLWHGGEEKSYVITSAGVF